MKLQVAGGNSRLSGSLYMPDSAAHLQLLNEAFVMFATTNPLHADTWPSVRQMEAEVVAMTASLLGGGPGTTVCGSMTSGEREEGVGARGVGGWAEVAAGAAARPVVAGGGGGHVRGCGRGPGSVIATEPSRGKWPRHMLACCLTSCAPRSVRRHSAPLLRALARSGVSLRAFGMLCRGGGGRRRH